MFKKIKHIHFVGIGGIGMSGIAEVLLNLGYRVSGSDMKESDTTERLRKLGGVDLHRPPVRKYHDPARGGDFIGRHEGQCRSGSGAGETDSGYPARRDACRAHAAQVRHSHCWCSRQDDDDIHGRDGARRRRYRSHGRDRRQAQQPRHERQARSGRVPCGRGGRERRELSQTFTDHCRGHDHRRRAPRLLQGHRRDQRCVPRFHQQGPLLRRLGPVPGPAAHPGTYPVRCRSDTRPTE